MSDINVSNVKNTYSGYQISETKKEDTVKTEEKTADVGAVYEKSQASSSGVIYKVNQMSAEDRAALVQKLKDDDANRRSQLTELVQKMFTGQAGVAGLAELFSPENMKNVTAADIAQAKEDISEDGYWGVKQTSQRLFDFAAALAGDDVDKMKEMQAAMEKGFKMAEESWGRELPDISKNTMDAANKLFEEYYASKTVA